MTKMRADSIDWLGKHEWDFGITSTFKNDVTGNNFDKRIGYMWKELIDNYTAMLQSDTANECGVNEFKKNFENTNFHCHICAQVP